VGADASRGRELELTDTAVPSPTSRSVPTPEAARRPSSDPEAPRPRGRRLGRRLLGWSAVLAVLVAAVGLLLSRRFYYGNDDLLQFAAAREDGLSWPFLSLDVFLHFAPYNRFGHWLVVRFSDLDPTLGLSLVLVNYAALLAACLWLTTELRLSTPRRIVALVLVAFSVPMTESAVWFDAGMHILPAIAVTLAVCAAHVRGVRTAARRWHVLALVLVLIGQLTQERPIFALPLVVLVDVLLLWRAIPWRARLGRLWQLRVPLAALAVAAAAIAVALRTFVVDSSYETPSWSVAVRTMVSALANFAVPSMVNQPLAEPSGFPAELFVLAGLVGLALVVAYVGEHNSGPLLFTAAVFLVYYGFLKFSPLLNEDNITFNAGRLHYAVYATVPAAIALAHLRLRRPGTRGVSGAARRPAAAHRLRTAVQLTCCLALAGYLLVSNNAYLDRKWADATEARAYLDRVRAEVPRWSDPAVTLVPLLAHPAMATDWSWPLSRHDQLLPLLDENFVPGAVGGRPMLIDHRGSTRPAALRTIRPLVDLVSGGCSGTGRTVDEAELSFPVVRGEPLLVELEYYATEDLHLYLTAGMGHETTLPGRVTKLAAGSHTRLVPIDADMVWAVELKVLTSGAGLCVRHAEIVRPLLVEGGGVRCRSVDWYGTPRNVVECP
jgi:hypothetical protein